MNVANATHHAEAVAKCPTIRLGISDECFTYCNSGFDVMNECPFMHVVMDYHQQESTMEMGFLFV